MYQPYEYQVSTKYSKEDEAFISRVREFPSLATHGDTEEESETEMRILLAEVLFDMELSGEVIPDPLIGDV